MNGQRLLLDQMLDADVASSLRAAGHDIVCVSEIEMARSDDDSILAKAIDMRRILVTLDQHFGDWAVLPLCAHSGVIRVKAVPAVTENILSVLMPFLQQFQARSFENTLAIVSSYRVRWITTED